MYLVGLTGGIASGKSTVAGRFVENGAVLIDADVIAREVVEPGSPGLTAIAERFGNEVIREDGTLDRDALGAIVFADVKARKALEAITHPLIGAEIAERFREYRDADRVVVLDAALLVEGGRTDLDALVVVAAHPEVQIERLMTNRAMGRDEAEKRVSAQAPLEEKLEKADFVIWNEGSIEAVMERSNQVWDQLCAAAARAGK